jgi:tryptophan synthase alpha chain
MFAELEHRGEGAFVPFLVLGDPDPDLSLELVRSLARAGADALELGIPFSDPIADGPVIQAAAARALAAGVTPASCWALVERVREEFPALPIGLLVYANLVVHRDPADFYRAAADGGVDSVLVADAPVVEVDRLRAAARAAGIAPILIAPPNADRARLRAIAERSEGYVYVVSRPGVTGADDRLHDGSERLFRTLEELGAAPGLLGFGVSRPEHVRDGCGGRDQRVGRRRPHPEIRRPPERAVGRRRLLHPRHEGSDAAYLIMTR